MYNNNKYIIHYSNENKSYTMYNVHCTFTLYTVQCTVYIVDVYTVHRMSN